MIRRKEKAISSTVVIVIIVLVVVGLIGLAFVFELLNHNTPAGLIALFLI